MTGIDEETTETLHRQQRTLRTVRCEAMRTWVCPKSIDFGLLTTVQLLVSFDHHLDKARKLLIAARNLHSLEISVNLHAVCSDSARYRIEDRAGVSNDILRVLLGSKSVHCRAISTLRIRGFDLSHAAAHLYQAVRPSFLRILSLQYCKQEITFLRMLTAKSSSETRIPLQIRHLEILKLSTLLTDARIDNAIDDFLVSFTTLESLIISAPKTHALRASPYAIAKHQNSLRTLYLEYEDNDGHGWVNPLDEFDRYLPQCRHLEQLAMNFPWTTYDVGSRMN